MKEYYQDPRMSQSRLKDWLKCPNYYNAKHVTGQIPQTGMTPTMLHGSLVDAIVTQPERIEDDFTIVDRRPKNQKQDEEGRYFVNPKEMKLAETAAERINMQPVMDMFRGPNMQAQVPMFTDKCKGLLDFFGVNAKGEGIIADLKTMRDINKVEYEMNDWDWRFQLTYYRMLAKELHPKIKKWNIYIIGLDKTKQQKFGVWKVRQQAFYTYEKMIKSYLIIVGKNIKVKKGRCFECPPEVGCEYSLFTRKHIKPL